MSLTRNHSSLELLCQTAGALEACDGGNEPLLEAVPQMDMPRVSPTNLVAGGASSTTPIIAPTQSPFDNSSFVSSSRANSSQYLVGTSPSHDSFSGSGFEDDDDMEDPAVPSQHRPWVLNDGHHVVNIRESYIKTLGQPSRIAGHQPSFAPSGRSSSFCPPIPTLRHTRGYPTHDNGANPIYSPVIGYDNRHAMSQTQAYMDASSAGGAGWPSVQDLVAENSHLRSQLCDKDRYIESLMAEVSNLQGQVSSLKSLPVGKISQIPVE
ncbi:hypothetical protein MPSEU_001013600 [Mayamaea pseudoterrestris]|nr:hypothetical protein MPSEU_001013600 [Mayamaea pseudoterrestris]